MARRPPKDLFARKLSEVLTHDEFYRIELYPPHGFGFEFRPGLDGVVVLEQRRGQSPRAVGLVSRAYAERRAVAIIRDNVTRSRRVRRRR